MPATPNESCAASPAPAERGFTLIEMVITCVIATIVVAIMFNVIIDLVDTGQKGVSSKRASERAMGAIDQIGLDVRSAVSRDRAIGGGVGTTDLEFLSNGYTPAGAALTTFIQNKLDIVTADRDVLRMYVPHGDSVECVTYEGVPRTDGNFSGEIRRTVSVNCPYSTTDVVSRSTISEKAPVGVPLPAHPFSYETYSPTATSCATGPYNSKMTAVPTTENLQKMLQIAAVTVSVVSNTRAERNRGTANVSTQYAIRSRLGDSYVHALGGAC